MANEDRTSRLKTTAYELVKQYIVYDVDGRQTDVYTARTDAADGGACTRTQYEYVTATTRVNKRKESNATWDSTWDM